MSDNHADKKRKGENGHAVPPVKVESSSPTQHHGTAITPPDHSKLSNVQHLLWVDLSKEDSDAVEVALFKLGNLCRDSSNRAAVASAGGLVLITLAMKKWYAFPAIQRHGCLSLGIAILGDDGSEKSWKDIGALDAVLWAMKNYPNDVKLQGMCCGALSNIVNNKPNAEYVAKELNCVELIVSAMGTFKDSAGLQRFACWALNNLLKWDDFKKIVKEAGGRRALLDAIENHEDESQEHVKDLQRYATSALKKLL